MPFYPSWDPNAGEIVFNDDVTQACVRHLDERLTERVDTSSPLSDGVFSADIPRVSRDGGVNHAPVLGRVPLVRWDESMNHHLGSPGTRSSSKMQSLDALLKARRYEEFRDELVRAEIAGQISEFYALNFQAILAVVEGSEFASDYLEMAAAVASSPYELAVIAENHAAYDLLQGNPLAAAEHCLAILDHVYQTEGLWNNLLIALYRLGEVDTIDATLRSFAKLDDDCTARLVGLLSTEPDLHGVRARPAFKELLDRRANSIPRCHDSSFITTDRPHQQPSNPS
jgi:hypothetical protein